MPPEGLSHHAVDAEVDGAVANEEDLLQRVGDENVIGLVVGPQVLGPAQDLDPTDIDLVEVQEDPGGVTQEEGDGEAEERDVQCPLLPVLGVCLLLCLCGLGCG